MQDQTKERIHEQLESYLQAKGINTQKNFNCLNPTHADRHPSMSYDRKRNRAHCFSCGADYDTFDVIGIDYQLTDYKEIFNKAAEVFYTEEYTQQHKQTQHTTCTYKHTQQENITDTHTYRSYIQKMRANIGKTGYPALRGLSTYTINSFGLGYDPAYKTKQEDGFTTWQALIIPNGDGSFIARNTDTKAGDKNRIRKKGPSKLFNLKALEQVEKPVFIVEGEFDAMSIAEAGGQAIALGSTANQTQLLNLLNINQYQGVILLSLDADEAGRKTQADLLDGLQQRGIRVYEADILNGCKDANEALLQDREEFIAAVRSAEQLPKYEKKQQLQTYLEESAGAHIVEFYIGISNSVNTPHIATGFPQLDTALDGGLFEGLYIVGAISSLGKTTFVLQLADQIANTGRDVLFFSLEMARSELMAKSISRHSLLYCLQNKKNTALAKTSRGITTGKRYTNYTADEMMLIKDAMQAYGTYANHIYIHEGIGDIGAQDIRAAVQYHKELTGELPVVVIDYLQILAPYNERYSDKQNTDKAVLELKRISRDYKIPVIGISSFNRQNYRDVVTMEAFKESGAIEYSSDVLIGLQLEGAGTTNFDATAEKRKNPRNVELRILKNRNGEVGAHIGYNYYPLFNYFEEQ